MNKTDSPEPLIKAGWLRALIYGAVCYILYFIAIHFEWVDLSTPRIATNGTNAANPTTNHFYDSIHLLIFTLLIFALTFAFRRWLDRKSFESLGFSVSGRLSDAVGGSALAILIVGASSLILKATGDLKWMDIIFDPRILFMALGSLVLMAVMEELIFRGYILGNLLYSLPRWPALLISAVVFMLFHWTPNGFFPLINTFIMGLIMGLNYSYTRNLWFSIGFHIGWKFLEGPILGLSPDVSQQTLLVTSIQGNENATGGINGLEGSYMLAAVSLLSVGVLFLVLQKKFSPQSPPAPGRI
jgi:uncharacterized protein